ncbi:hypothetical protein ACP70R_028211 [Stipagrostis hirtigluma subsp. patula]
MASSKLIVLFLAFAVAAAATLQPSDARVQPAAANQEADGEVLHPSTFGSHHHGAPPPPRSPAGPPAASSPPSPPAQPTECLTPLIGMMTCMDYLTNITVLTPPGTCCDGLKSVIKDAPICLCHGMNGDMNKLMPRPIDPIRMLILPLACGTLLPLQTIFSCNTQAVPPLMPPSPPMAPATPPASP